jgi:dTMP kinase
VSPSRGFFITLEGGEGGGKSTQTQLLSEALKGRGRDVVLTREPGGSPGAEAIRALLVTGDTKRWDGITETLLHYAARRDHVERTVRPALAQDKVVISDRFADSTMAYQGFGHGVDRESIRTVHTAVLGDFAPHLTLILDLPVDVGLERARKRGGDENRYEKMGREFHERLRRGFLAIASKEADRCVVIDAARPPQAIHADVLKAVLERLP